MTGPHLPAFLRGQNSESIDHSLARPAAALATSQPVTHVLDLRPDPDSARAAVPLYLAPMVSGDGFHLSHLLPLTYDAWMRRALTLDDAHFNQAVQAATGIYADVLSRPWGVLCALPSSSVVWLRLGHSPDDTPDPGRTALLLQAVQRESAWLRTLDGRFAGPLVQQPGPPWAVHTTITFLAARHGWPRPTSWRSWDDTVNGLLEQCAQLR